MVKTAYGAEEEGRDWGKCFLRNIIENNQGVVPESNQKFGTFYEITIPSPERLERLNELKTFLIKANGLEEPVFVDSIVEEVPYDKEKDVTYRVYKGSTDYDLYF